MAHEATTGPVIADAGCMEHCRRAAAVCVFALSYLIPSWARACPNCATSNEVWSQIADKSPWQIAGTLLFAFLVVAALIVATARWMQRGKRLFGGALLLGAGLGAFADGIVLHQVLQWHAMLSSVLAPDELISAKVNMFWDGIFHLFAWFATVVAVAIVVHEAGAVEPAVRRRTLIGGGLAGWGYFNLVEGLLDHQLIGLHHVHPGANEFAWDIGFLIFGAALVAVGAAVALPVLRPGSSAARE